MTRIRSPSTATTLTTFGLGLALNVADPSDVTGPVLPLVVTVTFRTPASCSAVFSMAVLPTGNFTERIGSPSILNRSFAESLGRTTLSNWTRTVEPSTAVADVTRAVAALKKAAVPSDVTGPVVPFVVTVTFRRPGFCGAVFNMADRPTGNFTERIGSPSILNMSFDDSLCRTTRRTEL